MPKLKSEPFVEEEIPKKMVEVHPQSTKGRGMIVI